MSPVTINAPLTINGPVIANGPVYVQGLNVREEIEALNRKLDLITQEDLPELQAKIKKLLSDYPIEGLLKSELETINEWIEVGKTVVEIVKLIKESWTTLGPIIGYLLLA